MAKRTKFQAELILRSRPPSAFDVLREAAERLSNTQTFPPGVVAVVGETIKGVLDEVDGANAQRAADKAKPELEVAK